MKNYFFFSGCKRWSVLSNGSENIFRLKNCFLGKVSKFLFFFRLKKIRRGILWLGVVHFKLLLRYIIETVATSHKILVFVKSTKGQYLKGCLVPMPNNVFMNPKRDTNIFIFLRLRPSYIIGFTFGILQFSIISWTPIKENVFLIFWDIRS